MKLLTELQYFPPVILIKAAIEFSNVEFDIYDEYRKMSFRNRCVVAGGAGPVNLSVPLLGGRNQRKPMKDVQIDNKPDWQGQHWKTITSCYNRSPWFEFYKHELEEIYRQPVEMLVDWNKRCWNWVMEKLDAGVKTEYGGVSGDGCRVPGGVSGLGFGVSGSDGLELDDEVGGERESGREVDDGIGHLENRSGNRQEWQPESRGEEQTNSAHQFLDWRNKLMPRNIAQDFPEAVRYRQVFEERVGFLPHLSILDLLFCEGKRTVEILKSSKIPI